MKPRLEAAKLPAVRPLGARQRIVAASLAAYAVLVPLLLSALAASGAGSLPEPFFGTLALATSLLGPGLAAIVACWRGPSTIAREIMQSRDGEPFQAAARIFATGAALFYLGVLAASGLALPQPVLLLGTIVVGVLAAWLIFAHVMIVTAPVLARRAVALVIDIGCISAFLHFGAALAAPWVSAYLLVSLSVGLRFGAWSLAGATVLSLFGFASVVLSTPLWQEMPAVTAAVAAALVVVPLQTATLIRRLDALDAEALAAREGRTRLLAVMAHELRAPLDTLIGLGALLGKSRLDSAQRNMVGTMQLAARTLSGLLGDLLELAKLGAGRPAPKPETFVLHQILGGTVSMLRPLAEEKGLGLALSIDPRLPAACRGLPAQLRQLLLNLIANAMKFTARGSIAVAASLAAHNEQNFTLRLAVREDGTGVPAAQRARIAARATPQADTSDGGLGLAIARELVELMGGSIAFGNQEGSGTIVTVELPLIGQPDAAVPAPDLAGRLLLIVGPDQVLAAALQNLLKGWHGEAQWYADGEDLLVALGERGVEQRPILLLDGRSETLAGLSLAHRLAMRLARPPLILFIAPARGSEVIAGLAAAQLAAVIEAPVGETSLAAALLSILAAEPPSEGETQPAEPDLAPGLRVLIADDSSASRDLLKSLLASAGHGVEFAGDGGAALAALDREQFDLALLDVDMAGMGGDAVTQLHRLRHPGEKRPLMVALAAEDNAETERRCRSAGMDAVLRKPVNAVELQAVLDGLTTGEVEPIGVAPSPMVTPILAHPRFFADAGEVVHEPTVDALHTLGGPDFVAEVVQSFRSDAARLVDQLRGAVERGDLAAFGEFVHSLRSGAANVGGVRLTRMLTGLKDVTAKDLRQAGPFTVEKIAGELNRLEIALDAAMRVQRQG